MIDSIWKQRAGNAYKSGSYTHLDVYKRQAYYHQQKQRNLQMQDATERQLLWVSDQRILEIPRLRSKHTKTHPLFIYLRSLILDQNHIH